MKKIFFTCSFILISIALSSCNKNLSETRNENAVQVANPASEYCIKTGGISEIVTSEDGSQYGLCNLSDGTKVEEWEYYRNSIKD